MLISFLVFLFALFLVFGAYLLATQGSEAKRARLRQRLSEALLHSAHTDDPEVVLARNELLSEIPALNRLFIQLQVATRLKRMLDQADRHRIRVQLSAGLLAFRGGSNRHGDGNDNLVSAVALLLFGP